MNILLFFSPQVLDADALLCSLSTTKGEERRESKINTKWEKGIAKTEVAIWAFRKEKWK